MALEILFIDGFDHYATAGITAKGWSSPLLVTTIDTSVKRTGASSLRLGNSSSAYVDRPLGMLAKTVVCGFAIHPTAFPNNTNRAFLAFGANNAVDSGGGQILLILNTDGTVSVYRGHLTSGTAAGGAVLATTSQAIFLNAWTYLEFRAYIHDTAGEWELRINGATSISGTGVDTKQHATADYVNTMRIISAANYLYFDDLYVRGATDYQAGGFLGDVKVLTRFPQGAGTYSQLTSSSGNPNWQNVDEATPDTADYNHTNTTGHIDTYDFAALADAGSIKAVQLNLLAAKDDAGSRSIEPYIKSGATEEAKAAQGLSITPTYKTVLWENDPNTSEAWTETNLNNAEFGARAGA